MLATHTPLPNEKLSPWYFAVRWAIHTLKAAIAERKSHYSCTIYDERALAQLEDLEQFLKMSWDEWMLDLRDNHDLPVPEQSDDL
jgi:hypothetical protein